MRISPYVNFNGDCREAFTHYQKVLGGTITAMVTLDDMPMEGMGPEWKDKILHAQLVVGDFDLMGSDTPAEWYAPPRGMNVSYQPDSIEEAERVFAELAEGGEIQMAMEEQPWAHRFGITIDRFGVPWMVSFNKEEFS